MPVLGLTNSEDIRLEEGTCAFVHPERPIEKIYKEGVVNSFFSINTKNGIFIRKSINPLHNILPAPVG